MRGVISILALIGAICGASIVAMLGYDLFYTDVYTSPNSNPGEAACGILFGLALIIINGYLFWRCRKDD